MDGTSSSLRALAEQILACELSNSTHDASRKSFSFQSIDRLRPHFSELMGRSGFQALLARALARSAAKAPWMTSLKVADGGHLEGLANARDTVDGAALAEGELVLVTHILGLLVAFIGQALTVRLIDQIWPQLSSSDANLGSAEQQEDAK